MEKPKEQEKKIRRLFLSDLDGTLIHKEIKISENDVAAIKKWKKAGNLFGLVTGRDFVFCHRLLDQYDIEPDCLITCNGAITYWKDKRIDASLIDLEIAKSIFLELQNYLTRIDPFYTAEDGSNYFLNDDEIEMQRIRKDMAYLGQIHEKSLLEHLKERKEGLAKISISARTSGNCDFYLPIFQKKFENVEVMATSVDFIEMTRKNTDKSHAMNQMIKHEKLDMDDIIFIGDGSNDIPLFKMLTNTYVMNHANDSIKQYARNSVLSVSNAIEKESKEN